MRKKLSKIMASFVMVLCLALSLSACGGDKDSDNNSGGNNSSQSYTITLSYNSLHGTAQSDKTTAKAGDTVTVTVSASTGYESPSWAFSEIDSFTSITGGSFSFEMPPRNTTVYIRFEEIDTSAVVSNIEIENDILTWDATNSQAFEILVDGENEGFGYDVTEKTWTIPETYKDGLKHKFKVVPTDNSDKEPAEIEYRYVNPALPTSAKITNLEVNDEGLLTWKWSDVNNECNGFEIYIDGKLKSTQYAPKYQISTGWVAKDYSVEIITVGEKGKQNASEGVKLTYSHTPKIYTITFDLNYGSLVPETRQTNEGMVSYEDPTRAGYNFAGWFTSTDEGVTLVDQVYLSNPFTANTTLYADWVETGAAGGIEILATPKIKVVGYIATWNNVLHSNGYQYQVKLEGENEWSTIDVLNSTSYNASIHHSQDVSYIQIRVRAKGDGYTTANSEWTTATVRTAITNSSELIKNVVINYDIGVIYWDYVDGETRYYDYTLTKKTDKNTTILEGRFYKNEFKFPSDLDGDEYYLNIETSDYDFVYEFKKVRLGVASGLRLEEVSGGYDLVWDEVFNANSYKVTINNELTHGVETNRISLVGYTGKVTISIEALDSNADWIIGFAKTVEYNLLADGYYATSGANNEVLENLYTNSDFTVPETILTIKEGSVYFGGSKFTIGANVLTVEKDAFKNSTGEFEIILAGRTKVPTSWRTGWNNDRPWSGDSITTDEVVYKYTSEGNTLIEYIGTRTEFTLTELIRNESGQDKYVIKSGAFENPVSIVISTNALAAITIETNAFVSGTKIYVNENANEVPANWNIGAGVEVIRELWSYDYENRVLTDLGSALTFELVGGKYKITDCDTNLKGVVEIPSSYKGYPINKIEQSAFIDCKYITEVYLSDNIIFIGHSAFRGCSSLKVIRLSRKLTIISEDTFYNCSSLERVDYLDETEVTQIDNYAFYGCSLINLVFPETLQTIGTEAFRNNKNLYSVTLPQLLTTIESGAFYGCNNLVEVIDNSPLEIEKGSSSNGFIGYNASNIITDGSNGKTLTQNNGFMIYDGYLLLAYTGNESEIVIPTGVTEIKTEAFYEAYSLYEVVLPSTLKTIGNSAFAYSNIRKIVIPEGVETIGNSAFSSCINLLYASIPSTVTTVGTNIFYQCNRLAEYYNASSQTIGFGYAVRVNSSTETNLSTDANGFVTYNGTDGLELVAYFGNEKHIVIPTGVVAIKEYAFYKSNILSAVIPEGVIDVKISAFDQSTIYKVTLPSTLERIESRAFANTNIVSIILPASLTYIYSSDYSDAFEYCYKLYEVINKSSLTIVAGQTTNGSVALYAKQVITDESQSNVIEDVDGFVIYDETLLIYTGNASEVVIPTGVVKIDREAFNENLTITSVIISEGVEEIGNWAFTGCDNLKKIKISSTVTTIESSTFPSLNLTNVIIDSATIYNGLTNANQYGNLILNAETIEVLKSIVDNGSNSNSFLNNTQNYTKTESTNELYYTYTKVA